MCKYICELPAVMSIPCWVLPVESGRYTYGFFLPVHYFLNILQYRHNQAQQHQYWSISFIQETRDPDLRGHPIHSLGYP